MTPASRFSFYKRQGEHSFISLPNWGSTEVCYCIGSSFRKNFIGSDGSKQINVLRENAGEECHVFPIERGSAVKNAFDTFFEWTGGNCQWLGINCTLRGELPKNATDSVEEISKYLAGRSLKVKMYQEEIYPGGSPHSPINDFLRNYVDFEMYSTGATVDPDTPPLVISEKLLNCEFLYLTLKLVNSEVLIKKFNGWGLVVRQPDPHLNFQFFYEVVQKWYSGDETHWEYLSASVLNLEYASCKNLASLGKEIQLEKDGRTRKELEITRADGQFCRIGRLPHTEEEANQQKNKQRRLYFYIGECSDGMFDYHSMGDEFT